MRLLGETRLELLCDSISFILEKVSSEIREGELSCDREVWLFVATPFVCGGGCVGASVGASKGKHDAGLDKGAELGYAAACLESNEVASEADIELFSETCSTVDSGNSIFRIFRGFMESTDTVSDKLGRVNSSINDGCGRATVAFSGSSGLIGSKTGRTARGEFSLSDRLSHTPSLDTELLEGLLLLDCSRFL